MKPNARKRIGDLLIEANYINNDQLLDALKNKSRDEKIGDYLINQQLITEQQLIQVLELQLGIPLIHLGQNSIEPELIQLVPKELAKRANIMPVKIEGNKLLVAMADPMDYFTIEELRMATGYQIEVGIAAKDDVFRAITRYYDLQESMDDALDDIIPADYEDENQITDEDSPIVRLVNQIIANGVAQRASDIHFDPQDKALKIRYRVDGVLRHERSLPKNMQNIIIARVKIMGNLNITEHRIPQDGRIKSTVNLRPIDIRLSTLPTIYGEKIVMRILDLSSAINDLDMLGFSGDNFLKFKNMLDRPNGIILITGPTGSGKSSTLYAGLNHLNNEEVNIITIEDPVEYQLEGINQIQVREEIGLSFSSGLRSILRQDPDVIMVGEIRDMETAQIAIRSSLTGHLVLSTLHTNSAIDSISRLTDMGIETFLLSSSLIGIMAQRLVRRVCRDCSEVRAPNEHETKFFEQYGEEVTQITQGLGCPSCNGTGYRGRLALHEILSIDDAIRSQILNKSSSQETLKYARSKGYKTLVEDGLQKVSAGQTTIEEVLRVATSD
ncbi:GspE/PulE family protein [Sporosarcina sp. G11-34]|uniref:GspE/PulE family protein n=1 Tax=Sporosarcina sp. G11-34 TaxID=2849605 RepID=UPI0022A98D19|nr:ATPase, T2SS/T4P/T4SS family [Sporosarcina sp. G11-34]MCZ2259819.1 Flp pilus assembly complex ATPase component TadA [Sporosarcina sp. G11-34]